MRSSFSLAHDLVRKPVPTFRDYGVRQVSRPWSRIIVDGGGESAGVRPRIYILAHDLVRKPVPTFRDHALDAVELAFLGDAFEGLAGTLDPVLVVVAFRRQQLEHRIAAGGGGAAKRRRGEVNRLADLVLVRHDLDVVRGHRLHRRARRADYLGRPHERQLGSDAGRADSRGGVGPRSLADRTAGRFRRLLHLGAGALGAFFVGSPGGFGRPAGGFGGIAAHDINIAAYFASVRRFLSRNQSVFKGLEQKV